MASEFLETAYEDRSTEEMRAFYDRWAKIYDAELADNEYAQPRRCAAALIAAGAMKDEPVLDVGCGTGLSGLALRQAGFASIDGCDLSPGMLEKAARINLYGRLFECDLNKPPLDCPPAHYGALAAVGVFSFGHVQANAIDEMLRVVRPGGALVIGMNDHYYQEGSVPRKLARLAEDEVIDNLESEHGDHLPGIGLTGWVLSFTKA